MRKIRSVAMAFPLAALVFASIGVLAPLSVAAAPCAGPAFSGGKETITFCFTGGAQTWKVPAGVTSATFSVSGAQGGNGANSGLPALAGGLGGRAVMTLAIVPGSTITIVIGGQGAMPPAPDGCLTSANSQIGGAGGFNGGGRGGNGVGSNTCGGSGGGGARDVRIGGNRKVVGGGGGGASQNAAGGVGGGSTGGNGGDSTAPGLGGKGGTQVAGGAGGFAGGNHGVAGSSGVGGAGGVNCGSGGGGGGGGWFGGGGGGAQECSPAGGGGGGSGKDPALTILTSGVRAGNGIATVNFAQPLPAASASEPPIPWLPIGGLAVGLAMVWFGLRRRRATV